jgi:hypothetical protein
MSSTTFSSVVVKVILENNSRVQCGTDYITVNQDQSIFECLIEKFGDSQNWTKLKYNVNGVLVTGWRLIPPSGIPNPDPTLRFKYVLDKHFKVVFVKQNLPIYEIEIYLRRRT